VWAHAQRDGCPAEYRWRPLFNVAVWLTPTTTLPGSNAAKTRKPLKLAGVPQTNEMISAASRPKFTILWGYLEEILLFKNFFPIVDTCHSCEDIAREICATVPRRRFFDYFLRPAFPASRLQHISDLHSKLTLRPRHVWKYGDIQSAAAEIRRGIKKEKEERKKTEGKNIMACPIP